MFSMALIATELLVDKQQVMSRLRSSSRESEVIDMDLVVTVHHIIGNGL